MKKTMFAIASIVLLSGLFSSWSWTAEKVVSSPTVTQKEQYKKTMEDRFKELGKGLDELKAKVDTQAEQARKEMDRSIKEAEKKQKIAARKLEEMRSEGKKRWNKFTEEMNAAMDEFEKAYEKAQSHFKE